MSNFKQACVAKQGSKGAVNHEAGRFPEADDEAQMGILVLLSCMPSFWRARSIEACMPHISETSRLQTIRHHCLSGQLKR